MIGRHPVDGLARHQPHAFEHAAVAHEAAGSGCSRRPSTAGRRRPTRTRGTSRPFSIVTGSPLSGSVAKGSAMRFQCFSRHRERRVLHAQRLRGCARAAARPAAGRRPPRAARPARRWRGCIPSELPGWCASGSAASTLQNSALLRERLTRSAVVVLALHGAAAQELVGESRPCAAAGRAPWRRAAPARSRTVPPSSTATCWPANSRQVLRHRIAQLQPAFLGQHQRGQRHQRLGHRVDAEDRIACHRRARGGVLLAQCHRQLDMAAQRHHRNRTRDAPLVDVRLQYGAQPRQGVAVQAAHQPYLRRASSAPWPSA